MKLIIASLLVFSLVIVFLFALFPADITVSRVIQINQPSAAVMKKINDLREWRSWNELLEGQREGGVPDGKSNKNDSAYIHLNELTIRIEKSEPDTIITRWERESQFFMGSFNLTESNRQTILEWTFYFHIKWYPWDKLASMFYDRQLGPLMEKSLINLRNELEKPGP